MATWAPAPCLGAPQLGILMFSCSIVRDANPASIYNQWADELTTHLAHLDVSGFASDQRFCTLSTFPRVRCVTHPVTMPGPPDLAPESGYDGHACVTWFSSVTEWYWLALARTWGNTRLHLSRSRSQEGPKVPANDTSYQRHRDA